MTILLVMLWGDGSSPAGATGLYSGQESVVLPLPYWVVLSTNTKEHFLCVREKQTRVPPEGSSFLLGGGVMENKQRYVGQKAVVSRKKENGGGLES